MGHTNVKVKVYGPKGSEEVELLVDTGSTYSWVSRAVLEKLGVEPMKPWNFRTIEGRIVSREIGEAVIQYDGEKATTVVVFGEEKDSKVLGVYALEGLRLEVDPLTNKIKKSEALLAI